MAHSAAIFLNAFHNTAYAIDSRAFSLWRSGVTTMVACSGMSGAQATTMLRGLAFLPQVMRWAAPLKRGPPSHVWRQDDETQPGELPKSAIERDER